LIAVIGETVISDRRLAAVIGAAVLGGGLAVVIAPIGGTVVVAIGLAWSGSWVVAPGVYSWSVEGGLE